MLQPYLFIGAISAFWDGVLLHWNIRDKCQLRYQNINANADANADANANANVNGYDPRPNYPQRESMAGVRSGAYMLV